MIKKYISLVLKGAALGTANVIPGVSGGTIALVTGIFERLINAIKSFDIKALKLLLRGNIKSFAQHTDLVFLVMVFGGVGVAIISLARIFEFLFVNYPVHIWAFFFGLIMASVFYVGKRVEKWKISGLISLAIGAGIALIISFINPASENSSFSYLLLCGVVAVCSMILPGLSGSFVLILMGNYKLVMIEAINEMRFDILLPVVLGAVVGLIAFSHLLSWVLKHYHDQTMASLTGFIFGSLGILWPWKNDVYLKDDLGELIIRKGEKVITGYQYYLPEITKADNLIAFGLILTGILVIYFMERSANIAIKEE